MSPLPDSANSEAGDLIGRPYNDTIAAIAVRMNLV